MDTEARAICGFTASTCAAITAIYAWMPVLQVVAVIVAIVSGLFAIAISIKKLRSK